MSGVNARRLSFRPCAVSFFGASVEAEVFQQVAKTRLVMQRIEEGFGLEIDDEKMVFAVSAFGQVERFFTLVQLSVPTRVKVSIRGCDLSKGATDCARSGMVRRDAFVSSSTSKQ